MISEENLSKCKYIHYIYTKSMNYDVCNIVHNFQLSIEKYPIIYINKRYVYFKKPGCDTLCYIFTSNLMDKDSYNSHITEIQRKCKATLQGKSDFALYISGPDKYIPDIVKSINDIIRECKSTFNETMVDEYLQKKENEIMSCKSNLERLIKEYNEQVALFKLKGFKGNLTSEEKDSIISKL